MKIARWRIASWLMLLLAALVLTGCWPVYTTAPEYSAAPVTIVVSNPDYAYAQATLASGSSDMAELSQQATLVSLNIDQAANAMAQTTLDYNQRKLMELSIRGTEISQNMAQAAATQQLIIKQTQAAWDAAATAQSQAATSTFSAYALNVTQTAQAQVFLDARATETAQADATQTAYSLTATPMAVIQADITRNQQNAERRDWWEAYIYTPLIVVLSTLVVALLIVGGVLAYRRLMPVVELRVRSLSRNGNALLLNGVIIDVDPFHHQLPQPGVNSHNNPSFAGDGQPQIEIIGPSEPSISNWIIEAEQQLRADREGYEI